MTHKIVLIALLLAQATASIVELNCSDNATCIDNMAKELMRSIRQRKTVKLFDVLTVEPLAVRQARASQGLLSRFLQSHAFSFDWDDWTFRLTKPQDRSDVLDLVIYESRTAKDDSEAKLKKSNSKVEEEDDKTPKRLKRRHKKKVLQAVVPLVFGMKSAATAIFALALVTALTIKAFIASKLALVVTVGMALKKLYETYSSGVGLQNHPYLYSQYPIDFPSASSHAYSVSGVSPQFASPEMYNPTALATHSHTHEMLQHNDASAQQSQQAPMLQLVNNTRASERWDGKSKLLKLLEPIVDRIRSFVDPIANVFYDAMPATFRGLNSDVSKKEPEVTTPAVEDKVKKPREILVAQPRYIAQRKMFNRKDQRHRPKKHTELKIDLDKLKRNKDLYDYIKTKKYKHNYPHTYFYPRIKYFVNPTSFITKPNNKRLIPYRKETRSSTNKSNTNFNYANDWKPVVVLNYESISPFNDTMIRNNDTFDTSKSQVKKLHSTLDRAKRDVDYNKYSNYFRNTSINFNIEGELNSREVHVGRGFSDFFSLFFAADPISTALEQVDKYAKAVVKDTVKVKEPHYYKAAYKFLMFSLDLLDGLFNVNDALSDHLFGKRKTKKKKKLRQQNVVIKSTNVKNEKSYAKKHFVRN